MKDSFCIEEFDDLNKIDLFGTTFETCNKYSDFIMFVFIDGYLDYYIKPSVVEYAYDIYNSYNGYIATYGSLVDAVARMYDRKKL